MADELYQADEQYQANELCQPLVVRIDKMLQCPSSMESTRCSIFKVPNQLRQSNEKAYEPQIISIGPYHRGKHHLEPMEEQKIRCVKKLLQRRNENSVARYVLALKAMEEKARKWYAEPLDHIDEDTFLEMMLLDGCFIVELIRGKTRESEEENGYVCGNFDWISIKRDLLLLENQLPFFVLLELFQMTQMSDQDSNFIHLAIDCFQEMLPGPGIQPSLISSEKSTKNLLGLLHDCWLPSPDVIDRYANTSGEEKRELKLIRTAAELEEAGIYFKYVDKNMGKSMFDIEFEKGVLWIPTIHIVDDTDSILRNLVAYERCHSDAHQYVTDYVILMDGLIGSKIDVEILSRSRVIENWLADDKAVATVFNKLGESVVLSHGYFYSKIFMEVRNHYDRKWNIWMAGKLKAQLF